MNKNLIRIVIGVGTFTIVLTTLFINNLQSSAVFNNNDKLAKTEESVSVGGELMSEDSIDEFTENTLELASFIQENNSQTNTRVSAIEVDIENFPKRLMYVEVSPNEAVDSEAIKKHYNDIVELAREESLLTKNEKVEIILMDSEEE